jgi:hypothetical protein
VARELEKATAAAKDQAAAAGETLEDAGDAVGSTAKKTWECLTSWFSEC